MGPWIAASQLSCRCVLFPPDARMEMVYAHCRTAAASRLAVPGLWDWRRRFWSAGGGATMLSGGLAARLLRACSAAASEIVAGGPDLAHCVWIQGRPA